MSHIQGTEKLVKALVDKVGNVHDIKLNLDIEHNDQTIAQWVDQLRFLRDKIEAQLMEVQGNPKKKIREQNLTT